MTNPMSTLEETARRARLEAIPEMHVSMRVLATLHERDEIVDKPLLLFSLFSAASAAAVAAIAFTAYQTAADPLLALFDSTPLMGF